MINKIKKYIKENNLLHNGCKIIVALSGGADSVCLLRVLVSVREEYNLDLYAVHVNHGIRGREAERDEKFSLKLAADFSVTCKVYYYDVPALSNQWKMTEEEAGRKVRYEAFEKECAEKNADYIAVAHHMNDQAETLLFRMCRGTGIKGLCGISVKRDKIIRPLLCVSRNQIEEYLENNNQSFVNDSTNKMSEYDRNKIRNSVVPKLCEINERAIEHICESSEQIREVYDWFEKICDDIYNKCVENRGNGLYLDVEKICVYENIVKSNIVRKMIADTVETLKDIDKKHIMAVLELFESESGKKINLPYSITVEKQYEYIRIYIDRSDNTNNENVCLTMKCEENEKKLTFYNVYIPEAGEVINELGITYKLKKYNNTTDNIPKNSCIKWLDYAKMNDMLKIRRIQSDDYLLLDGDKRKKISRYLIDEKIPRQYRNTLLVIAEGNNVLYVVGGKMGKGCYVTDSSCSILEVKYIC